MKRFRPDIVALILVLLVVAVVVRTQATKSTEHGPVIENELKPVAEKWQSHYDKAQALIEQREFSKAEKELQTALMLARALPQGDRRLAESLDDLGLVYFMKGEFRRAKECQGSAVAALLLAAGPDEPEVSIYIERFQLAHSKVVNPLRVLPKDLSAEYFLTTYYTGLSSERVEKAYNKYYKDLQRPGM